MALPSVGGGYQTTDGNVETVLRVQPTPAASFDTATLTVAQLINGIIVAVPTAAAAYTLPLATDLDNVLTAAKPNSCFDFHVINLASNAAFDITMTTNTGWVLLNGGVMVVQELSSAHFRARKISTGNWVLYRLA